MPIAFTCLCGKRMKVPDDSVGKKVRCPECSAVSVVAPDEEIVQPLTDGDEHNVVKAASFDSGSKLADSTTGTVKKRGTRIAREEGEWQIGDEVLAAMTPDCLNVGTIKELRRNKALVEFTHSNYSGWVFVHTFRNIGVHLDQEVKCFDKDGGIRDGKVVHVQGDHVRVVFGWSFGSGQPISWTEEMGQFDISDIGIPCEATSPGAKSADEFAFYEDLEPGVRVWAPWEQMNLYPGKVAEVKGSQLHVYFDNGNRGWVMMGQVFPYAPFIGEYVTVCKGAGYNGTISDMKGQNIQVRYDDGGKKVWVAPSKLMKRGVLPMGPPARPTRIAGGLLLKLICIPLGGLLALIAAALLIWNEDYAVKRAKIIAEGASSCVSINADQVDGTYEGKLVHVSGEATTDETLRDESFPFPVSAKALKLIRIVEIFQWVETSETKKETGGKEITLYHHKLQWVKDHISSAGFHEGVNGKKPINIGPKFIPDGVVRAKEVKVGAFKLTDEQVDRIGKGDKLEVPESAVANPPDPLKKKVKILNGVIYIMMYPDTDPTNPNNGDLRITFTELKPQPVTVVAKQSKGSFEPWLSPSGETGGEHKIDEIRPGIFTMDDVFQKAVAEMHLFKMLLRVVGGTMLVVGVYLLAIHWWLWRKFPRKTVIS
jgi:hypothetical protein